MFLMAQQQDIFVSSRVVKCARERSLALASPGQTAVVFLQHLIAVLQVAVFIYAASGHEIGHMLAADNLLKDMNVTSTPLGRLDAVRMRRRASAARRQAGRHVPQCVR
jgi:hypothetical protein